MRLNTATRNYEMALATVPQPAPSSFELMRGTPVGLGAFSIGSVARAGLRRGSSALSSVAGKARRARHDMSSALNWKRGLANVSPAKAMTGVTRKMAALRQPKLWRSFGLGDAASDAANIAKGIIGAGSNAAGNLIDQKTKKLEDALKLIIGLSGVAALTGTINLLRR